MDLINRHRNLTVLVLVLSIQIVGLAVQVKRPTEQGPTRLVRVWGIGLVTPVERAMVHSQNWVHSLWRDYFYLRDVRRENDRLQDEILRLRLEQIRLAEDAAQARRLQALLKFKEQFVSETVAAQVIGSSGTETSRILYIDKGERDGIKPDMAVMSPAGIVGKVFKVFAHTAQILQVNDQSSGVGAMLEKSRLQGILKATPSGETMVRYVMADEKVEVGERVVTSGDDGIFPKGLPIGRVEQVNPGPDTFLNIRIEPAAHLDHLEEVLVITRVEEKQPSLVPEAPMRASDILAERLPTVSVKPPDAASNATGTSGGTPATGASTQGSAPAATKPPATLPPGQKPASTAGTPPTAGASVAAKPKNPVPPNSKETLAAGTSPHAVTAQPKAALPKGGTPNSNPPARATTSAPNAASTPKPAAVKPVEAGSNNQAKENSQ